MARGVSTATSHSFALVAGHECAHARVLALCVGVVSALRSGLVELPLRRAALSKIEWNLRNALPDISALVLTVGGSDGLNLQLSEERCSQLLRAIGESQVPVIVVSDGPMTGAAAAAYL